MSRILLALFLTVATSWTAAPELSGIQSVYLIKMGNSLDQYLATRLAETGRFRVVTDPATAQAVMTDHLGEAFEREMERLYPKPEPPAPEADEAEKSDKTDSAGPAGDADSAGSPNREDSVWGMAAPRRGRGNIYLVDVQSRRVLWAGYKRTRDTSPDGLRSVSKSLVNDLLKEDAALLKNQK